MNYLMDRCRHRHENLLPDFRETRRKIRAPFAAQESGLSSRPITLNRIYAGCQSIVDPPSITDSISRYFCIIQNSRTQSIEQLFGETTVAFGSNSLGPSRWLLR